MEAKELSVVITVVVVFVAALIGTGSSLYLKTNDGPIEQAAEAVILYETGEKIDLTPELNETKT